MYICTASRIRPRPMYICFFTYPNNASFYYSKIKSMNFQSAIYTSWPTSLGKFCIYAPWPSRFRVKGHRSMNVYMHTPFTFFLNMHIYKSSTGLSDGTFCIYETLPSWLHPWMYIWKDPAQLFHMSPIHIYIIFAIYILKRIYAWRHRHCRLPDPNHVNSNSRTVPVAPPDSFLAPHNSLTATQRAHSNLIDTRTRHSPYRTSNDSFNKAHGDHDSYDANSKNSPPNKLASSKTR